MDDLLHSLLFYDDLAPSEQRAAREALEGALEGDAALAHALRRWHAARQRVGADFRRDLPPRRLLVHYALAGNPAGNARSEDVLSEDALSEAERRELEAARPAVEAALRRHPALEDVLRDIRDARQDFEAAWDEHAGAHAPAPPASSPAPAAKDAAAEDAAAEDAAAEGRFANRSAANEGAAKRSAATRPSHAPDREASPRGGSGGGSRAPRRRLLQRWGWRVAAGVALVAFAAALFFVFEREQHTVTVTAEGSAARVVELPDGSTVRLLPGATLTHVDPEAGVALDRQATLEAGQAFFDIARAEERFLVETPTARVAVLGTRFGVTAEERLTRVVLAFGRVALASKAAAGQPVMLEPGQESRVAAGALPSTPAAVEDLSEALAWTGLFVFRDAPAAAIARQLAAHYGQAVRVAPPLEEQKVTGTFDRSRPLGETLRTLAAALDARVETPPGGGYALVPSGP